MDYVVSARISKFRPIRRDDYIFVFTAEEGVALAQVEAIYTKSGGKHAKHGDTLECTSIGAISNLDVQMFEHVHGLQFQVLARADPLLGQRFRFLTANAVLCLVAGIPTVVQPEVVSLSGQEGALFTSLQQEATKFEGAARVFRRRQKAQNTASEE
ncbi:hypothetical protein LXA43DRAFT_1059761 [Ganoderma leucocontextum]|nr:hypothetical protein LXA43DRAFT_1059761 [Ganoderma leucocontextum]